MEFVFAYGAGILTLINPCVLPVLPIVLAASLQAGRHGPLALAAGMSVSFVTLGLGVTVLGHSLGLTPETINDAGAVLMIIFGLVLAVPRLSAGFSTVTAGMSVQANAGMDSLDRSSASSQFLGGILLGAVWSPCIGPTLGGAISLASQGERIVHSGLIMVSFALGVSTVMVALGYGARSAIQRRQTWLRPIAASARPVLGLAFIAVGAAILIRAHHLLEFQTMRILPAWLIDLSVSL